VRAAVPFVAVVLLVSCRSAPDDALSARRAFAQTAKDATLDELAHASPEARARVAKAVGYAVFSETGASAFGARPGVGFGVAHDNRTGAESYLRMKRPEDAPPCRLVIAFADAHRFRDFAARGGAFDGPPPAGVEVWQLFAEGLAPAPEIAGTSFYLDPQLKGR
jgi:hypothetical protein